MFDYGTLNNQGQLSGIYYNPHTQVWQATHKYIEGGAEERLPYMYRSFISFSWGGKFIEDFNLIVVTTNNAIERDVSAPVDNLTTNLEVVDGQLFWGSHYQANTLDLTLHTDSITERQLLEFTNWFKPGIERQLILAQHPNRGIMARLDAPPHYSMLPFKKEISTPINGLNTNTTEYKGSVTLKFVMDNPFWYSINNFMEEKAIEFALSNNSSENLNIDRWLTPDMDWSISGEALFETNTEPYSEDAWKVIMEDGIPCGRMFDTTGADSQKFNYKIWTGTNYTISGIGPAKTYPSSGDYPQSNYPQYYIGAQLNGSYKIANNVSGARIYGSGDDISGVQQEPTQAKYYYAGNAPAKPILDFHKEIRFDKKQLYIVEPANKYCPEITYDNGQTHLYPNSKSTITLTSKTGDKQNFSFTTPSILTAYNAAVDLFEKDVGTKIKNMVDLRQAVIENIHHPLIRDAILIELGSETDLQNIIPRAVTFAIRRRFAYKVSDDTEANMLGLLYNQIGKLKSKPALTRAIVQLVPTNLVFYNSSGAQEGLSNTRFNGIINSTGQTVSGAISEIQSIIKNYLLQTSGNDLKLDTNGNYLNKRTPENENQGYYSWNNKTNAILPDFQFIFNTETGEATTKYKFSVGTDFTDDACYGYARYKISGTSGYSYDISGTDYTEGAGDMVCSDYLKLTEAGHFNEEGRITGEECYTMTHDMEFSIFNVKLHYRNMYY